jgi:hypothetical protein
MWLQRVAVRIDEREALPPPRGPDGRRLIASHRYRIVTDGYSGC